MTYSKLPKCFDGYKIFQISDLHHANFGDNNDKILKKINKFSPNIVVITGDLVSYVDTNFDNVYAFVKTITEKYDVYYVPGNHELLLNDEIRNEFYRGLENCNVKFLDNAFVSLKKDGQSINLYGLYFNLRYYDHSSIIEGGKNDNDIFYFGTKNIESTLGPIDVNKFNLLITHDPDYFDTYSKWGADLTLCGHIHGGLIRLPFIGGLVSPRVIFFPKYDTGAFTANGKDMILSRGLGNTIKTARVFSFPELVEITLRKE